MSLIEYAGERQMNPVDVVERVAAVNEWAFERAGDDEITISVTGRWTDYQVAFTWMDEIEALHVACAFDLKLPERRRAVCEARDDRPAVGARQVGHDARRQARVAQRRFEVDLQRSLAPRNP